MSTKDHKNNDIWQLSLHTSSQGYSVLLMTTMITDNAYKPDNTLASNVKQATTKNFPVAL